MKFNIYTILAFIFLVFVNISCHKTVDPPLPEVEKGTLYMHLHTFIDVNEVSAYNVIFTDANGRKISLSLAKFYISNIQLTKSDGSLYSIPDTIILKDLETETYTIADVPAGNYKSVRFYVGLDAATNLKNPSGSLTDVLNHSEMWFSGTAQPDGYVFLNLQGKIDTTTAMTAADADMQPFVYKIGTNANYKQVIMPDQDFTVLPNQAAFLHLLYDASKLFTGIQLNNQANLSVMTTSDNATPLATQLRNNIPSMFIYE